jgi:hypothetical protein
MPVPVMAAAALAQLGLAGYQMYKGAKAEQEAGEMPEYKIPKEMEQALSLAERQAFEGLPAEQKQQYIENLRATQATGLSQLSERKSGLAGVGEMQKTATQGYRDLLAMDAAARQQNIQRYQQQLETMAGYQDLAYQTNELQPWQREVEYGRAQQGAAIQNAFGAMGGMAQAYAYGQGLGQGDSAVDIVNKSKGTISKQPYYSTSSFYGNQGTTAMQAPAPEVNISPTGLTQSTWGVGGLYAAQQPQQIIIQ